MSGTELKPEVQRGYLKVIWEAIDILSNNQGNYRRDIWDYLQKNYSKEINYRDFLMAMSFLKSEGKL